MNARSAVRDEMAEPDQHAGEASLVQRRQQLEAALDAACTAHAEMERSLTTARADHAAIEALLCQREVELNALTGKRQIEEVAVQHAQRAIRAVETSKIEAQVKLDLAKVALVDAEQHAAARAREAGRRHENSAAREAQAEHAAAELNERTAIVRCAQIAAAKELRKAKAELRQVNAAIKAESAKVEALQCRRERRQSSDASEEASRLMDILQQIQVTQGALEATRADRELLEAALAQSRAATAQARAAGRKAQAARALSTSRSQN